MIRSILRSKRPILISSGSRVSTLRCEAIQGIMLGTESRGHRFMMMNQGVRYEKNEMA